MSIESDFHCHIVRSSALEMVQRAGEKGLRILGVSEHIFQMTEGRPLLPYMPQEGPFLSLDDYFARLQTAAEKVQLTVRIGLEVDFVPAKNAALRQVLEGREWDFLIGSVHEIDAILFEGASHRDRAKGEALWLRYFALLREAVSSKAFSVVSHPVRMRATNPFLPPALDNELEHLAAEATHHNVALEINGYDILTYPSLVRRLARACASQRTPISIGSDAHDPRGVAQGHALSEQLLREVGIDHVRVWKQRVPEDYQI